MGTCAWWLARGWAFAEDSPFPAAEPDDEVAGPADPRVCMPRSGLPADPVRNRLRGCGGRDRHACGAGLCRGSAVRDAARHARAGGLRQPRHRSRRRCRRRRGFHCGRRARNGVSRAGDRPGGDASRSDPRRAGDRCRRQAGACLRDRTRATPGGALPGLGTGGNDALVVLAESYGMGQSSLRLAVVEVASTALVERAGFDAARVDACDDARFGGFVEAIRVSRCEGEADPARWQAERLRAACVDGRAPPAAAFGPAVKGKP